MADQRASKGKRKRTKPRKPRVREGQGSVALTKKQFAAQFRERFYDPAFDAATKSLDEILRLAWDGYVEYRKSPRTRPAGRGFADPTYELPVEWLETRR